jgi:hypothetical protein
MATVRDGMNDEKLRTFVGQTVACPEMASFNIDKTSIAAIDCFVKRYRNEEKKHFTDVINIIFWQEVGDVTLNFRKVKKQSSEKQTAKSLINHQFLTAIIIIAIFNENNLENL